jgi:transcriptional regulator with XRE-family HTH domain
VIKNKPTDNKGKMTDLRALLAQNIKKYRKIRGFSQEILAEKAKTSLTHIGMIEIGRKFPSVKMLEQIADALGIDTPELFAAKTAIFLPSHNKSIEHLYNDIMDEFENFKKNVAQKIKG